MLKVHVEQRADVTVLHVEGRIVRGAELSTLRHAMFSQGNARSIVLDLAMVNRIDGAGLGAMLEFRRWALEKAIKFKLEIPDKLVANVFRISRLDSVFDIRFEQEVFARRQNSGPLSLANACG